MIKRLGKYEQRALLLMLLILTSVVAVGSSVIYINERHKDLQQTSQHAEQEMGLVGRLITEALTKRDYVTVEQFIDQWALERPDLVDVKITATNGFELARYMRSRPTKKPLLLSRQLVYGDEGSVRIDLVWDTEPIHQHMNQFLVVMVAIPILLVAVLLFFLGWVLRRTLLQPMESELEKSEQYNRMLFEQSPIGLALCRMNGELVDINPAYARIIGRGIEETLPLSYWNITPEKYAEDEKRQLDVLNKTGRYGPYEKEYIHKDGHLVPVRLQGLLLEKDEEQMIWSCVEDITERQRTEETVRNIAAGVSAQTGEAFFQSLVMHLAKLFDTEYTFIGLLDEQRQDMIDTVALCVHGKVVANLSYALAHTPCKHVVEGNCDELQAYPRDIQRLFPDDSMLEEMGAHSYVGAPLADTNGKPIGLIVVMDNKPMENTDRVEAILRIFAVRAAAEMERLRTDKALQESQKMLKLVLDSIPVRVFWKDINSDYLGCNSHFAKDAGLESPEQIIGKNDFDLSWHEQAELYRSDDQQVMQSGVAKLNYEEPQTWPDDTRLWLQTSKIPLKDLDSNVFGILGVYEDISERKRAEEKETSLGQIMDGSLNEIYIFDADTLQFIQVNRGAMANLGYSMEEMQRLTPVDIKPEITSASFAKLLAPLRNGKKEKIQFNTVHRRKDGSLYPVEVHLQLSTFESTPAFMAIILDITERMQAEGELEKHRQHLEELVAERTTALEVANKELEAFSYSVSHDLRAPLRAIDGFSQALLEDYGSVLDAQGREFLDRTRAGAQRMSMLIDDLLQLSKVTRSDFKREDVDLGSLAQSIMQELKQSESEREVEMVVAPALQAHADGRLMRVVLENLLGNAWKFTGKKAAARIEFGQQQQDGVLVFYVRDNGAGFDMRYADKLFGAFQRLHTTDEFPGTGIGLATVQRIIHRHGGRVWAESEADKGATFYFTLGLAQGSPSRREGG